MKEKNQNTQVKNKKGKHFNKKVVAIGTTAIVALAAILGVYMLNRNDNSLANLSPELARSMEYERVQEGEEDLDETNNVKFDAFFLKDLDGDGYAESIRGTCNEIGDDSTLYMELNVLTEGYLKDAKITINGDNFYLQTNLPKDDELAENYVGNNIKEINLNQINNGTQKLITGLVRSGDYTYTSGKANAIGNNVNNYSSNENSVTLTGTYVTAGGEEIPVEKKVDFTVDWYGTTRASIYNANQSTYIDSLINEEEQTLNLSFTVYTEELNKELLLSSNHTEVEVPEFNGYAPLEVVYTGSNATANYNAETRILTLDRTSTTDDNGNVTSKLSTTNSYSVRVTYPLEAYTALGVNSVQLKIPVSTYYEGYNNTNDEFTNPYKSNTARTTITATYSKYQGTNAGLDITVGNYISSPSWRYVVSKQKPIRLYNGQSEEERDDTYIVKWQGYIGTNTELNTITMKETPNDQAQVVDQFIKTDSSQESMEDVTTNVGIYFSGMDELLGTEGYINVYDEETGNLLVTFTSSDWNKYTSNNPYRYENSVKHIRVETSPAIKNDAYFYVYNVKELDDDAITTKYERAQFDELQYIKSQLVMYIGDNLIGTDTHQAHYEAPYSIATISISNNTLSTQATEENDIITIHADANTSANQVRWLNGTFLVKLPEEMLTAEINNVEISNSNVTLESYELIKQDGINFIKIVTKNDQEATYDINIDVDLTPDPRIATTTKNIELYASNENGSDYYYKAQDIYDVNNNLNTTEQVNHTTTSISMVSPNSLLTNQTASDYDDKGSTVVSPEVADIKPVYAVVDQEQEEQTVKIGVQIKNNYASTISEIEILGKIPFEGNTYVLSGSDLGSTFTTTMVDTGIEVPQELLDTATIYYSTNENPDRDLTKAENNWKTADQVENWDEIKTFLIDLGDYVMPTGKEYVFYYTVKIPNGLEFNQTAFSHHGVYFSLDTEDGKYRTQTEPNKLGFRIAEKYNLELSKFQTDKDKLVPGATYSVQEIITDEDGTETRGDAKTGVTNAQGKLTITNLYAEKTYELKEIKTPDDYELNSNVIRFIGHVDEQGTLTIEKTGETKEDPQVIKEDGEDYKVTLQVEDEVKASIKITKKEQGTDKLLSGIRYKLTGYNLPEKGKTIRTNSNGEAEINGISINQEYTLEEVKADGYYLASPIKFKVVNNSGNYSVEVITEEEVQSGTIASQNTTEEDSIPTINITLEDEKIPTYNLQLFKIQKTTESTVSEDELIARAETDLAGTEVTPLANATFKLFKGEEELGRYTTGEDGKVTIEGLYQYESEKDIDQTYTLKEVMSPEGYAKVQDISFRVQKDAETNELILIDENNVDRKYTVDGNTVTLTIEDSPSFKLIKKDAETKEELANIKFAIFNVDDGTEQPARNSKGEIIGTKETINGREYYTVQTDSNGELTVDLPEGLYKAVEVQAPEQYDLSNQSYYFGIGASREAPTTIAPTQAMSIGGSSTDYITSVAATEDGGYIAGGYFSSSSITVGDYTLTNAGDKDGMIIKYDSEGEVEWAKSIGSTRDEEINSISANSDGGYIVGGYFYSSSITVGDYTLTNSNIGSSDGIVIKYSVEGEVEWVTSIGGGSNEYIYSVAGTEDGGYIVGGYFYSSSITVGDYTLTNAGYYDGMVIKYSVEGEVEWVTSIGGGSNEYIYSVAGTEDGGYIVGGYFQSGSITVGDYTLTNKAYSDGMLIKYNAEGEVEWARSIGENNNEYIYSVAGTSDGGYIAGGYFSSNSITVGDYTLINNGDYDGMVIKYSAEGEVERASSIGGDKDDLITSVTATSDGGYIVGGYYRSASITVGDNTLTNAGREDGIVIKYSAEGEVEWARSIGESNFERINSVLESSDGGYIVGGYFNSSSITVGDYTLINNGNYDGMVIKFENVDLNNPTTIQAKSIGGSSNEQITSVSATSDGGYIAGGHFYGNITVGDYTLTNVGQEDGMVIKYDSKGEVEWATSIGGDVYDEINSVAETTDGGYIVGGYVGSSNITVGDYCLTWGAILIKYDSDGKVEWTQNISGSNIINSVAATRDGGCIAGGRFYSSRITVGDYTLINATSNNYDGMVIKYDSKGEVEWATSIGGDVYDEINSVAETTDGGYIVGGYFSSSSITVGNYTLTNAGGYDGMLIKYDKNGEAEWVTRIGGSQIDQITSVSATNNGGYIVVGEFSYNVTIGNNNLSLINNVMFNDGVIIKFNANNEVEWVTNIGESNYNYINSVAETSDGGYIVGGNFKGRQISLGNYTITNNSSSTNDSDSMIIKYNSEGKTEWAKSIGGSSTDYIESVTELNDGSIIAGGYFNSSTIETDGHTLINNSSSTSYSDGMILKIANMVGAPEVQELIVENSRKVFNITTDVNEIDGIKGGSISGEDLNPYEEVKYGDNSVNEIKMTPDEGYEIIGITVNGEEWPFVENEDGTYTIPQFENVTEDKHIVVTYSKKDNKIVINKVDSETQELLEGVTFKLDQIEERTEPEGVIGSLTDNGATYKVADTSNELTDVLGTLTDNGTYTFVEEDGKYVPTNSKTYQLAHDGTAGIGNSTANSYMKIDLSDKQGEYVVVVNAEVSSQSSNDYGYATITQSTTAPTYSSSTGRFIYISGTISAKDYTSTITLEGGEVYYLHLGYRKSSSTDTGDDRIVFNSIKVYGAKDTTYNFIQNSEGKYESTNQGKDNTVANSYIPIDLTGLTGKYNLIVNAEVSSQSSYDYGYATVTSTETAPTYSSSTGRFIYISGTTGTASEPTDYTTVLQGGQKYYLHFGYRKDTSVDSGDDKFTVNSVKVTLNDSELYHTEVTTNSEGQAITQIPFGKYQVTEVNTPEGYESIEPITINFKDEDKSVVENNNNIQVSVNENGEFTVENKQLQRVIVHHYLKNDEGEYTETKVAEDEVLVGKAGEEYKTTPHLDLDKYELEKDAEGNYVIPENANGTYDNDSSVDQEVIYYYETKDYPLIVHHYIEGTTNPVPLKDGSLAEDEEYIGKEGDQYTTNAIEDSLLDERYELVETPENANGNYIAGETIVIYYYKIAERPLTITKTGQDGLPLPGVTFEIQPKEEADKEAQIGNIGTVQPNGDYYFVKQNGKYISNNQQQNSTTASSYIKIDLTGKESATLKINAEISSQSSYDYGYATITSNTTVPSYSSSTGRIFRISGQVAAKDYTTTLNGGQIYYLHLCYYKNSSTSSYKDTFTINSITINDSVILPRNEYVTDDQGKINVTLDAGEYVITETEVPEGYKLPDNPTQTINITKDQASFELNIQNEKIPATVTVHHYIENTETQVPSQDGGVVADEVKTGLVGDIYATQASSNIAPNYEYVSSTDNTSGTMTEDPIEVIYYYRIKDAGIENEISKTGTEKITSEDQLVEYTITYTGKVTDYIGKATVTITDTLPYEIDEAKSSLDGGQYNDAENTITWTIDVEDIDTYTNAESGNISITKQISVAYENMDYSKTSFENKVQGSIYLEETEQEEPTNEDTVVTETEFTTNVTVTKKWNHTNNIYTKPTQVEVQVKNGEDVVARQVVNSSNKVGDDENTWSYTFTNLPKYDENGELIIYTVDEAEVNSGDLAYYDKQIEGNTITNTYAGPIISAVKESSTADEDRGYVLEGETITYTITVTNDGGRDKLVTVQDNAPDGTTFKAGSIKVNGSGADNYTEANLNSGIQVNVPAKKGETAETATVSFEVIVNPLEGEDLKNLTKTIRNTAVVDGQDTNPVTDIVNKSEVKFNKTSDPEEGSEQSPTKVTAGNKITYTINLTNKGTAPATTIVKDAAPEGTTFAGNIVVKVNGVAVEDTDYDEADLRDGITVTVPAKVGEIAGTVSISFDVTVNDLSNNTEIINQATVGEGEEPNTNEVKHLYVEPEIASEKTTEIYNARGTKVTDRTYALEGETIKYTITVTNNGGLATGAVIKDSTPEGTTFVDGSIEVVNAKEEKDFAETDLNTGIEVNVPEKVGTQAGTAVVSFEVRVNTLEGMFTKVIENTATVDETPTDKVEVTVNKPNVIAHKESTPANGENVKAGEKITYRIVLDNTTGTAPGTVAVKDTVPTGTTYEENSLKLNGEPTGNDETDLANGLSITVPAGQTSVLEFTVTVNGIEELADGYTIRNQATVEDEPTEEITHTYIEPEISAEKTSQILNAEGNLVEGRDYALEGETIKYTITVTNDGGLSGDAIITDEVPTGTTFVEGSIEVVNAKEEKTFAETDLNTGIAVTVPAHGTASVSFEVTVQELTGEVYKETIENTAHVKEDEYDQDVPSEDIEVKKPHIVINKTSDPANGAEVTKENEITYYIYVKNDGEAPTTVTVKDSIPVGTTYKEGSIKVQESEESYELADLTTNGIELELNPGEDKTVEFTVTVNDLENRADITNIATVQEPGKEEKQTDPVVHHYVEAIINASKSATIENKAAGYAKEDETITYCITITNTGDLGKTVTVKDMVPVGTSFVEGSIKVNNEETEYTQTDLQNGIDVEVLARTSKDKPGTSTVTFEVTVNELADDVYEGTITNKATVDETDTNEVQTEVKKAHIVPSKSATPAEEVKVTAGNEITYTITLTNEGTAQGTVTVKDEIPEGTTFVDGSIKVQNDSNTYSIEDLTLTGIEVEVPVGETRTVEFTVKVNDINNGDKITNKATSTDEDGKETPTDEVEHTYVEPEIEGSKTLETANGLGYVVEGEVITYTITATNTGDLYKDITISDQIPDGTTFVTGSIKVNGEDRTELTQDNLEAGIEVNVPARTSESQAGEASISFQVTVNTLDEGIFYKEIENTAVVDGKETDPVEEIVNKSDVIPTKTSEPASGSTVREGNTITYTINLTNDGTAPAEVTVKDEAPVGTTFKEKSIKVNGVAVEDNNNNEEYLRSGIKVTVPAKVGEEAGTATVSFEVTVNDYKDGEDITNTATVNDTPTNETTHKYIEPIISGSKAQTTQNGLAYVVEGETITYTITVKNDGGLAGNAIVKDEAPAGTTFVEGSIKVNGVPLAEDNTEANLQDGITVNVPAKSNNIAGTATVSFDVTVDPLQGEDLVDLRKDITNTATVNENPTNEVETEVNKADLIAHKSSEPESGAKVTVNNEITYTITLDNSKGTAPTTAIVKDTIPDGTRFVEGSIKVGESSTSKTAEDLASGIAVDLDAGESTTLEFKVRVQDIDNNSQIRNVATVNDAPTNETTHTYVEPIISQEKSAEILDAEGKPVEGRTYALAGDRIKYTITVTNDGGLSKYVVVKDEAPVGTEFVEGSIKANNSGDDNYLEDDLKAGITVNVPAYETATVSFEVTVGEVTEGYTKLIENTATVDENPTDEVTTTVNKPDVTGVKESTPASGETVENGEEITYCIRLTNNGTAPDTVTVKDTVPAGTEFVDGSIKVGQESKPELTEENLNAGIEVPVEADGTNTLEFRVKVVDNDTLENGNKITNTATVNDTPTNETEHTYIEPIIDAVKTQTTEHPERDYVLEGETISYTITVTNTGDLGTTVNVRDSIPTGTKFVENSIVIVENTKDNSTPKTGTFTQDNLEDGIDVNVGAQNSTTITFQVKVDELPEGTYYLEIANSAVVGEEPTNEVTEEVHKPNVIPSKASEPASGTKVTAGDPITYYITLDNRQGTAPATVTVKDTIPTGTTFVPGSIKVGGEAQSDLTADSLASGIEVPVDAGSTSVVEFKVTVNDLNNGAKITNTAYVDDEPTTPVEHTYIEPIINAVKSSKTENGLGYVVEGETITYTITINNTGDLGKLVTVSDKIPDGTTFVDGSIEIIENTNENSTPRAETFTKDNLESGIEVNVKAQNETTVSFQVTVNDLPNGELTKEILNTATVDGKPTDPVKEIVNKADVKAQKSSVPPTGSNVEAGDEITYCITVTNDGTAPATTTVKDSIPAGTTFKDGSIVVEGSSDTYELADLTTNGIEVQLNAHESKTVEFTVTVNDLSNGTQIRNEATITDPEKGTETPTNDTEHTYVEPIISASKEAETENGLDYVVEGETITYTITASNTGDAEGIAIIKDTIPAGTTFVEDSIRVNGKEVEGADYNAEDLASGIEATVPARTSEQQAGKVTLSFQVTVDDLPDGEYEGTIRNTATVNETDTNEVTEEIHKPNITATKDSSPASGTEVTAGNTITYTIKLTNQGTAPGEVIVKDTIPTNTTFVRGSIKVGGQAQTNLTADDLANGITVQLNADESKAVEFKVTVNDIENGGIIRNVASTTDPKTDEETPTNETEHKYVEPIISAEKETTTEKGLDYVGEGETITYTVKVTNTGDLGKNVIVKDTIPEGTTFVDGSIAIVENGTSKEGTFTKDDLENGIKVNVGAQNETTITFQVTVNDLPEGKYEDTIRNTAYVDDVPTEEITNEVKKAHVRIGKTSEPASGEKVTANDEIRYVIVLENTEGKAPITLQVKDSIPEGTTFIEGSIKVNGIDLQNTLEDLTTNGISVLVPAGETSTVEFKVKVNDLDNGYIIRNKANITNPETEESKDTNEVTHEYVEAVIEASKEQETEKGLSYVIPGEKITYTIRINNTGDLSKTVIVKDSVPQGTEFVEGSVLLNGQTSNVTQEQLEAGIQVEATGKAEQTISFQVTVLYNATDVRNVATVDGEETNETKVPVLAYEKTAEVIRQTEENITDGTVTAGDKIKYTIKVNNLGEEPVTDVTVKDVIPTGTTLSSTSTGAKVNDKNEITWTIDSIAVGESKEVGFEVTVNYDVVDSKNITNVATVDGEETNETETPYEKPEIKEESTIEKKGTEIINSTEDSITYEISYNASIKDFVGEGKVTLVDYLPYEIDVENQYLDGGKYDAKTKTITWEEDLGAIDTYTNSDKEVNIEKEITVKYLYGEDAETLEGTIPNRVEGTLQLTQKDPENPTQDKTVLEDKKETTFETKVQIPTYIIVHHYIEGTNTKVPSKVYGEVVQDETQEGFVGQDYTTSESSNVQENYKVVSNSGNTEGTMTRTPIEVIYYYKLQPGNIVTNTITKDGTDKIVNKDDKVSYEITYIGKVTNYVGNAKVEIVDYMPFAIDEAISDLDGGKYDPLTKTITWEQDLGRINTYTSPEQGNISITKNIEVVVTEMDYTGTSFINRAQGKITLEETDQEQETPEAEKVTETEFVKDITVEKVWDDNEDIKGRRPDSVTVQLTASGKVVDNIEDITSVESTNNNSENATTEGTTESTETTESEYKVVLNAENNWTHTFQDLPKYTEDGQEISYSVVETETNKGDLEYYEKPDIQVFDTDTTATVRVTNKYKLMNTFLDAKIEKTGTDLVTSSSQEVNYNIKYNATVEDYIGASLVTITDYLPYAIDETKSNLDGGTYDALTNTITWTENIDHINTYENGDYPVSIEKNITVVFTNLDATAKAMVNRVTGRIDLYENGTTNTVEATYETKIQIPGNVIVKYVDKESGKEIAEGYELEGLAGDPYSTEQKDIYGYTYVENTNNTSGNMIEGTIEVIYYYTRTNAGGVIVHYVDEEGNKLAEDVTISGKVQDPYKTEQKDIPNYEFVRVEGETEGELVEGTIEVTYIYKKIPAKVIVQYLEKDDTPDDNTDNVVLAPEETIEGFSGDTYNTERVEIENYKPADPEPENSTGTMTREDIYVTYYYERKPSGIVTVKYVDVDTNEEILHKVQTEDGEEYTSYREQMSGLCGLEYTTEQKDIPYYNFVEELRPSNATGVYTEEDIEVIYYYRKQTFNLSVNKQIDKITVNGVEHSLKEDLNQIDVVASKVQETDIVVTYKIIVSNPSEIEGTALVVENIPDFFRVADGTASEWTQTANKTLEAEVTLQPGETKELIVVLNWIKNSSNFGLQINTVTLQKVTNPANYEETDLSDNTSTAEVIFSVKTGGIDTSIVIGTALIVMLGALIVTIYLKERKTK